MFGLLVTIDARCSVPSLQFRQRGSSGLGRLSEPGPVEHGQVRYLPTGGRNLGRNVGLLALAPAPAATREQVSATISPLVQRVEAVA